MFPLWLEGGDASERRDEMSTDFAFLVCTTASLSRCLTTQRPARTSLS